MGELKKHAECRDTLGKQFGLTELETWPGTRSFVAIWKAYGKNEGGARVSSIAHVESSKHSSVVCLFVIYL